MTVEHITRRKPTPLCPKSARYLTERGYIVGKVERWIPQCKRRIDLFGFIDAIGICDGEILGIQVTDYSNVSHHVAKLAELPNVARWFAAGGVLEIHGWQTGKGGRGAKEPRRVVRFTTWPSNGEEQ